MSSQRELPITRPHPTRPGTDDGVRRVILLGSTGSIGTQTLDVIDHLNALADQSALRGEGEGGRLPRYRVVGLATGRSAPALLEQARKHGVKDLALADESTGVDVPLGVKLRRGVSAAERLVREVECDVVLGAMVGSAGLPATLAAVELGRDVALANKETLVAAGELVIPAARLSGSRLLPVDSEHCAAWQCLLAGTGAAEVSRAGELACPPMMCGPGVARMVLTASGGPFRTWTRDAIASASVEQALKHPTWAMGQKVTIDSASLTNKALEVIEAHWLFGIDAARIAVLVHPQSIVHAMVEFADGNVVAQLAAPDMRTPIQYALTFPSRPAGVSKKLDWSAMSRLDFDQPDLARFPALGAAYEVLRLGGSAGAVFNAANEIAVEAFLERRISFGRISELSTGALHHLGSSHLRSLSDALEADAQARRWVHSELGRSPVLA